MKELFQQALGIESPWFIKSIEFEAANKRLDIHVDFKRGATFSDDSNGAPCKAYDTVNKTWRHLNFFQHECYLHARVPRIKRDDGCGLRFHLVIRSPVNPTLQINAGAQRQAVNRSVRLFDLESSGCIY